MVMKFGKARPPSGHHVQGFRYYELSVHTTCVAVAFLTLIAIWPFAHLLPGKMLRQLYYPSESSLAFLAVFGASDLVQQLVVVRVVSSLTAHPPLQRPFAGSNRMLFLAQWVMIWALISVTRNGWLYEIEQIGPFAPDE